MEGWISGWIQQAILMEFCSRSDELRYTGTDGQVLIWRHE